MESISINKLALLVLATLLLLTTKTAPVVGRDMIPLRTSEDKIKMNDELAAKMMLISQQLQHDLNVIKHEAQIKQELAFGIKKDLQCVSQGSYCNIVFGPRCCTNDFACVPMGIVGGVCVA
ncbi:unnamed protein product [Amaranthus hypochondriacus]